MTNKRACEESQVSTCPFPPPQFIVMAHAVLSDDLDCLPPSDREENFGRKNVQEALLAR